jgi:beta-glucosidase
VAVAKESEATVVVAGLEEGEFRDRARLSLPGRQEELIQAIAKTGKPVIVVLIGGSAITMSSWLDQVDAVLEAWYPGEAGGPAVADVVFGDANPAGRLTITFPVFEGQLPLRIEQNHSTIQGRIQITEVSPGYRVPSPAGAVGLAENLDSAAGCQ